MNTERRTLAGPATFILILILLGGCSQPLGTREKGALLGGGLGAASGAIIGSTVGSPGAGAAIGGAMGVLGGGVIGDQLQGREDTEAYHQAQLERQQYEIERQRRELEELRRHHEY